MIARSFPLLAAALALGCVPTLDDPERFADAGCGDVPATILAPRCGADSFCHDAFDPAAGMDLVSGGLAERLAGTPAIACADQHRIDPSDPSASFLLQRVRPDPQCDGETLERMPFGSTPLTDREMACLTEWVEAVAAAYPDRGGPSGTVDAGPAEVEDAGSEDAGSEDAGSEDAGSEDAAP